MHKTIVEYPEIFVVLKEHSQEYLARRPGTKHTHDNTKHCPNVSEHTLILNTNTQPAVRFDLESNGMFVCIKNNIGLLEIINDVIIYNILYKEQSFFC